MGWASGAQLLEGVAKAVMPVIPEEQRAAVAVQLIELFENEDCDTVSEIDQPDIRKAYKALSTERGDN